MSGFGLLSIILSYLVGSIPFGLLLSRKSGIDIRSQGSGNIGATNVTRLLGKKLGALTLLCDAGKGFLPIACLSLCTREPLVHPRWGHKETLQSSVSSHLYDSRSVVILSENAVTMSPTPARKRVIIFTCSSR